MAKELGKVVKLQVRGGAANPSPPVGPALGAAGVNIMEFCKQFNARTQDKPGKVLPVVISVYKDKSFDFVIKTPPAAVQLLESAKVKKGSGEPNRKKVAKVSWDQVKTIAEDKMVDLNAFTIESAMKMVAAAKLRRAQDQALASRPYTSLMDKIVSKISSKASGTSIDLLTGKPENKTQLLVVFSADRGLCGGFNGSITRSVKKEINDLQKNNVNVKLLMVGKKSADSLNREYGNLFIDKIEGKSAKPNYADAEVLATKIIQLFENGEFGVCRVIYNKFVSAIAQEVTFKSLIPAEIQINQEEKHDTSVYEFEPSEEEILTDLLPRNLATQLFSSQIESTASELAARMTAMDNATRNAGEMIDKLTLQYNRTRRYYEVHRFNPILGNTVAPPKSS